AREGYPQARVDQIAAEAGVAKATVYNHFGDKENLFRETIAAPCTRCTAPARVVFSAVFSR
ncbi:TetR/AcrR family transcriptional regulator, partial [Prauserella flavalba]|uniref:TetR/AcrR family transcriptional regulator n=1 Tax=Prauserella flavalba TaxID=1477506 RepID=UPI0036E50F1D